MAFTEVLRIPLSSVEPPSSMITNVDSDYLRGIAKLGAKLVILLDLNKVLSVVEMQRIAAMEVAEEEPLSTAEVKEPEPISRASKKKKLASVASTG